MATTFAVPDGRVAMAATTYTGTGATLAVSNAVNAVGMQPDLVWLKARNDIYDHYLLDSVRGATKTLSSNLTTAEATYANNLTSFNSNGFSLGNQNNINYLTNTYVGWQWKAGGTAVSNTAGTITSSVSANTTAGFSVVTYTGNGTGGATIGHGLGAVPSLIIVKNRSNGAMNWLVYSATEGANRYGYLNLGNPWATDVTGFNNVTPTNAVFSVGTAIETNGAAQVAYCWAPVAGYSAFGSYTGNGSADGPFIYTGFRPRWFLTKRTDLAGTRWIVMDTSRNLTNVANLTLAPNAANAELNNSPYWLLDFVSNGFKIRGYQSGDSEWNVPGANFIYAAFAENPLKYANAR